MLSVIYVDCHLKAPNAERFYAGCHYAECHYAKSRGAALIGQ
jgi:hypothetical protein